MCTVDRPAGPLQVGGDTSVCDVSHAGGTSPLECPPRPPWCLSMACGVGSSGVGVSGA